MSKSFVGFLVGLVGCAYIIYVVFEPVLSELVQFSNMLGSL